MKKFFIVLTAIAAFTGAYGQKNKGNVLDLKHSITDQAIVYPESFEADTQKLLESWFIKNYTATDKRYATEKDVYVSDEVIMERLKGLPNVIEMPMNQIVRSYIDRFTNKGRAQVSAMLGLSLYYNPIFEQALEEQGLPLELKYLPIIESALDPNAVSRHGATGLWQFMLATAKGLGMEVNSLVDERRDPYLSSEMAAAYLKGLYESYGDWSLAIAAYNCGPGTVNKAIRRAGGNPKDHDFWSIYNLLPAETRGYVPAFIAANYVMTYYPEHNISPVLPVSPLVIDTVHVTDRIHFDQISTVLDIPVDELRILNPQYRADIIPGSVDMPRNLILPSQQIHAFLMSENDIKNYQADKYTPRATVQPGEVQGEEVAMVEDTEIWADPVNTQSESATGNAPKQTIVHKVKAGETLASIASAYSVSAESIKQSNNLRRNAVRVGQQLRITADAPGTTDNTTLASVEQPAAKKHTSTTKETSAKTTTSASKTKTKQKAATPSSHTVKKGESLSAIASKYGVSVTQLKSANGISNDKIQPGQKIKIPAKKSAGKSTSSKKSTSKKSTGTKKKRR